MRLIRLAEQKAKQLSEMLQASLKKHDVERVQARIRRHNQTLSAPQLQGRAVTVLNSSDVIGRTDQHIIHTHYCSRMPEARTQIVRHVLRPVVTSASIYSCCQLSSCCTALMHVKLECASKATDRVVCICVVSKSQTRFLHLQSLLGQSTPQHALQNCIKDAFC